MNLSTLFNSDSGQVSNTTPISSFFQGPSPAQQQIANTQYKVRRGGMTVTDDDLNRIRPLLYGEVSNRSPDKQELEANVIMNTVINRYMNHAQAGNPKTVADIISAPKQYQAYGGDQYNQYFNPQDPGSMAKKKRVDAIVDRIRDQMKSGMYIDNTNGAYYYSHDKSGRISYDDKRPYYGNH